VHELTKPITNTFIEKIMKKLTFIYDEQRAEIVADRLLEILQDYSTKIEPTAGSEELSEQDVVLITYGDQIKEAGKKDLAVLHDFLKKYFYDSISTVHILPFFPYSSDDGFSVIDYTKVDPEIGDWVDIEKLDRNFDLMFDAVINHISARSNWFQGYLTGEEKYQNFFIEVDSDQDLSGVTRPRTKPLLTPFETSEGLKHLWTTFSPDQLDLNYQNEEVLLEIVKVLLCYVEKGARIIRLDAIAYLWKEIGTSCIHLPETHQVIQLFRDIFEEAAPYVKIITETNVPHQENISYFGDGTNEAHLVYQFSLPPLVMHSFATGNAEKLTDWAAGLENLPAGNAYFNFLASHDGIGVRPAEGILTGEEITNLLELVEKRGGHVSYKTNSDGSKDPYELNITYFDAIIDQREADEVKLAKFISSQSILLSLAGVPGIYMHSLLSSQNYSKGVEETGKYRTINREKLQREEIEKKLTDQASLTARIYQRYTELIQIRRNEKAFHPSAGQEVLSLDQKIFALLRTSLDQQERVLALHNVAAETVNLSIDLSKYNIDQSSSVRDIVSGEVILLNDQQLKIELKPYQVSWLKF